MGSQPPASWTYAARAAYFAERVCSFCDHHNPAGAKFCNDCASPLQLKPCHQCHAVNDQIAANCYKCGAEYPPMFTTLDAPAVLPGDTSRPEYATPSQVSVEATVPQPLRATRNVKAYWPLAKPAQFLLAAVVTILIVASYGAYRNDAVTPDVIRVTSQSIIADEHDGTATTSAIPVKLESMFVEPETTAPLQAPFLTTTPKAREPAIAHDPSGRVPETKLASAQQRLTAAHKPLTRETKWTPQSHAAVPVRVPIPEIRKTPQPDRWQAMHVSLGRCNGDLFARIICDQRVRRQFCEGHWGKTPECGSSVGNDHGQ